MSTADRLARKQVLLTRIAFERIELRRDLSRLHEATQLPLLVRAALGAGVGQALFGAAGGSGSGWVTTALSLLRRWRTAAALLGGAAPLLRGRGRWRHLAGLAALAGSAWFTWRALQGRPRRL